MLKTFVERSGWQVLVTFAISWLAVKVPVWIGLFALPAPWDEIVPDAFAFVLALARLYFLQGQDPSIPGARLPDDVVGLSDREKAIVAAAKLKVP